MNDRTGDRISVGWVLLGLPMALFLLVPLVVLVLRSTPTELGRQLATEEAKEAIWLSVKTSAIATAAIVLAGTPLAFAIARGRFPFRSALNAVVDLPIVLPPAVAGLALLLAFGRTGPIGGWLDRMGIDIAFTQTAVVIAQVFVASPYYVRSAITAFGSVDREVEQSAQVDGGSRSAVLRRITLPLAGSGLAGGLTMAWARAMGEFGATILFAGNYPGRTQTMPLAIYMGFELNLDTAIALGVLLLAVAAAVLVAAKRLTKS